LGKGEDKRAAIVAQQAARELAERNARPPSSGGGASRKKRLNWAATPAIPPRRGRPRRPDES
jgi:hypothetical protein